MGFAAEKDPIEYCLATVKTVIENVKERFRDNESCQIFISGHGNFRDKLGTIAVYKGNRDPIAKPKYYQDIRQYVIDHHGAVEVGGMEAEDACGIDQWAHKDRSTVIVGIDKDLKMIPGYHYHPKHDTLKYIGIADANEWFWMQALMGDRTDNILGLKGIGPKTAEKMLAPCKKDWTKMYNVVQDAYRKQLGKEEGDRAFFETANLVWILREKNKLFNGAEINVVPSPQT